LILALAITGFFNPFFIKDNVFISIFIGFISAYFLFVDTVIYLFKHIKKLSILKANFILIKDLLIVLLFFIISNTIFSINFVFAAIGITIMPVSLIIFLLLSRYSIFE
jgi:Mg/Co/Ni transporter MgtE